jgi:hypothetical protein
VARLLISREVLQSEARSGGEVSAIPFITVDRISLGSQLRIEISVLDMAAKSKVIAISTWSANEIAHGPPP